MNGERGFDFHDGHMENLIVNKEKLLEGFKVSCNFISTYISVANEVARIATDNAIEALKEAGLYRQNTKRWCRKVSESFEKYERHLLDVYDERNQVMLDYLDSVSDFMGKDIDIFVYSLKSVFDKYNEPKSFLMAKMEAARVLLENAALTYEQIMEIQSSKYAGGVYDYGKYFRSVSLRDIFGYWENVSLPLMHSAHGNVIDLNDDKNVSLAFDVIRNHLSDKEFLNKIGAKALSYNIELARKYVSDEELKELNLL